MNIAIAAGGSLGHINPGIILGEKLSEKHNVIYITSLKDKRFDVFNNLKSVFYINCQGFNKSILHNINTCRKVIVGFNQIRKIFKKEKIDLVIGMGGYVSGISILTGNILKIKTIIHEQNKVIGRANKWVIKKVDKALLTFDIDINNVKKYIVSNPTLFTSKPNTYKERKRILITSGSNGAEEINDLSVKLINKGYLDKYNITLITGKKYYESVKNKINNKNVEIIPFVSNMNEYIYKSSIIISRAGSSTIFESIALDTVPLLIPSNNVTNNHQYYNSLEITKLGLGEAVNKNENLVDNVLKLIKRIEFDYDKYIYNIRKYKEQYSIESFIDIIEEED